MPHPSHYYVKFVLVQGWIIDPPPDHESITLALQVMGLPGLSENEFNRIRHMMEIPTNLVFSNQRHQPTIDFMKKEKIFTIWQQDEAVKGVLNKLMENLRVRDRLDILLMGRVSSTEIVTRLNALFTLTTPITERMVDAYKHYFWNPDLLNLRDWDKLLEDDPRSDALIAAYLCGPEQAFYRAGFNPMPEDPQFPLRDYYRQAYYVLEASRYKPDTAAWIMMRSRMANDLKAFYELLYGGEKGRQDRDSSFREFVMKKDPAMYKTWEDMQGTHTGDGTEKSKKKKGDQRDEPATE
jgi:hypothetical protein